MKERGKFIVFEGIGGSGKGTQIKIAERLLKDNGLKVISTREPGGVASAEIIRRLIFKLREQELIGPEGQMALFFAARKLWMGGLVIPNLEKGVNVLTDRCHTSTGAYQGYAEGGDMDKILRMSDLVLGEYKPDAVIFLDISRRVSMERLKVSRDGDPFDGQPAEYFDRLIAGYRRMAEEGWGGLRWYVINGEPKVEVVSKSVSEVLEKIFDRNLQR